MTIKPNEQPTQPPPEGAPPPAPPAPPPPAPAPPLAPPVSGAPPADVLEQADIEAGATAQGTSVTLPQSAFKAIKGSARAAGKRDAQKELLAPVLEAGFSSLDEMIAAAKAGKEATMTAIPQNPGTGAPGAAPGAPAAPAQPPAVPPAPGAPPQEQRRLSAEERRIQRDLQARHSAELSARDAQLAELKAKTEQHEQAIAAERERASIGYRIAAAGCLDVDYALTLYDRHLATLDEAGKAALLAPGKPAADGKPAAPSGWDQWFTGFKAEKAYLFTPAAGATAAPPPPALVPANTGPGPAGAPPAAPGPGALSTAAGNGQRVDYRKMTPEQRRQYDADAGLG